jgi:hypothetical protein
MLPRTFVAVPESAPARRARPVNRRHGSALTLSVILLLGPTVAAAQTDRAGEPPTRCTTYATGTDTHADCQSAGGAASSPAMHCTNSITGNDTHTECAPTGGPNGIETRRPDPSRALPTMPAPPLRCYSYAIGSSIYTDCR